MSVESSDVPIDLQANRERGALRVTWGDGVFDFPFHALRMSCECAGCVNEWTGERMLDPALVPADVTIEAMELVGAYAIRVRWSDGHDTGLYTWKKLRDLRARLSTE